MDADLTAPPAWRRASLAFHWLFTRGAPHATLACDARLSRVAAGGSLVLLICGEKPAWCESLKLPTAPRRQLAAAIASLRRACNIETPASSKPAHEGAGEKGGRLDDDETAAMCLICCERPRDTALVVCGHVACCVDCALCLCTRKEACPICRAVITEAPQRDVLRLYHVVYIMDEGRVGALDVAHAPRGYDALKMNIELQKLRWIICRIVENSR
ncbi:hypothetical protein CYMTET_6915 [Cymbomonas tetramitiformis]|uniref:RING-type domain-containing protein n=1 Tax=Cymbomonas tetramitiformis TaxID=36881 RepID=A0AAE0LHY8_9CHLO|nr:hypothetical protein CYMTET_6915 [Cymbomonas tetramitiformis]